MQDPDHKLPEYLSKHFSKETLNKAGFTEYHAKLYIEKMEKIIKEDPIVSESESKLSRSLCEGVIFSSINIF